MSLLFEDLANKYVNQANQGALDLLDNLVKKKSEYKSEEEFLKAVVEQTVVSVFYTNAFYTEKLVTAYLEKMLKD